MGFGNKLLPALTEEGSSLLPKRMYCIEYFITVETLPLNTAVFTNFFVFYDAANRFRVMASSYGGFMITLMYTPHSVGLLWTSDQPDTETSLSDNTSFTTDIPAPGAIRTHNPSQRVAADPHLRQCRH